MGRERKNLSPTYTELIIPTYDALKQLGGSGTNNEIYERVIVDLNLSDEVLDEPHLGSLNQSEVEYQLAWARTYLKNYGMRLSRGDSSWQMYYRIWIRMDLNDYHNDYYVSVDLHKYLLQKNQEMEALTELES